MTHATCIYCKAVAPTVRFNREHVLQNGFGKFREALVLHDAVCEPCNTFFSGSIDIALTRDSVEGLERYRWGVKRPDEVARFRYRNLTVRAHDLGDFSGVPVRLGPGDDERPLAANIVPSAAVHRRNSDELVFFSEDQILSGSWNTDAVDYTRGLKLFGADEATRRMRDALERQGIKLTYRPLALVAPPGDGATLQYEFGMPPEVQRGIAKIAFNYLAFREGAQFVLSPAFDPIRQFIRFGIIPLLSPLETNNDLPFRTSAAEGFVPVVHWVSLEAHASHRNLLGVVSLFSVLRHTVILAEDYDGPWFDLPLAHLYNVKALTVSEVHPVIPRWRHDDRSGS